MARKIKAGAKFAITQPVIGRDPSVDELASLNIPIIVESMDVKKPSALQECWQRQRQEGRKVPIPLRDLMALHKFYPECCIYLSMLSFKQGWRPILPKKLIT